MESIINLCVSILCAVISGVVLWRVQENKKDNNAKHERNVEAALHDRELLMAISEAAELTARKVKGEKINGELTKAIDDLLKKRDAVNKFTNKEFFRGMKK